MVKCGDYYIGTNTKFKLTLKGPTKKGPFLFYGAVAMDALLFCKEVGLGSTPTRSTIGLVA